MGELTRLLERRRVENGEHTWRECTAWIAAGGHHRSDIDYGYRGSTPTETRCLPPADDGAKYRGNQSGSHAWR
jgi:hypothetical protein